MFSCHSHTKGKKREGEREKLYKKEKHCTGDKRHMDIGELGVITEKDKLYVSLCEHYPNIQQVSRSSSRCPEVRPFIICDKRTRPLFISSIMINDSQG